MEMIQNYVLSSNISSFDVLDSDSGFMKQIKKNSANGGIDRQSSIS